jgi:hypothetical protein
MVFMKKAGEKPVDRTIIPSQEISNNGCKPHTACPTPGCL